MMMHQTPDNFTRPRRCDYAACDLSGSEGRDGWDFCPAHAHEHDLIMAGADLPDLPRALLPFDHGTESGYKRHSRLGIPMCRPCHEASKAASRRRNNDLYPERDRGHRKVA